MLKILFVHGVGPWHELPGWEQGWHDAVKGALKETGAEHTEYDLQFLNYKELFVEDGIDAGDYAKASAELIGSWLKDEALKLFGMKRGIGVPEMIRWTAGMVAQFAASDPLRAKLTAKLRNQLDDFNPHLLLGHSLGSLICYDTLLDKPSAIDNDLSLFTFGSQIAHPAMLGQWRAGRLAPLNQIDEWFHLYNENDKVFTYPVPQNLGNVTTRRTKFGNISTAHDGPTYMQDDQAISTVWNHVLGRTLGGLERALGNTTRDAAHKELPSSFMIKPDVDRVQNKALLIGVNQYADPTISTLAGCVNDAYEMSAALQACGLEAENIRLLTDDRATAEGIRSRLHWLLDDAKAGDMRVLAFSGHGTRIAQYGPSGQVESFSECICPHDFDWTPDHYVSDRDFYDLYSQLDYDVEFIMMIDSCHSGGLVRGTKVVRGIEPPDDIRHRELRWNEELQMWEQRSLAKIAPVEYTDGRAKSSTNQLKTAQFIGDDHSTWKLGSALPLRSLATSDYDAKRKELGHFGPYMPLMLLACSEAEEASEYPHGNVSFGAFTWAVTRALRRLSAKKGNVTYEELIKEATEVLKRNQFPQLPQISGPSQRKSANVPFLSS